MKPRQHFTIWLYILSCIIIASSVTYSQEEKKILTVPGDIHTPYDIIDAVAFVQEVEREVQLFGSDVVKSYNSALVSAFSTLEKYARKVGADAVINIQLQFVVLPGTKGNANELLVFGTLVKYKTGK